MTLKVLTAQIALAHVSNETPHEMKTDPSSRKGNLNPKVKNHCMVVQFFFIGAQHMCADFFWLHQNHFSLEEQLLMLPTLKITFSLDTSVFKIAF